MGNIKRRRGDFNPLSLSFLDVMSCGFGAVVLIFLILDHTATEQANVSDPVLQGEVELLEQEILEGLAEIVNEETGLDTESVQPEKSFTEDLDIDSLSMMTIVVNAEEKFGVRIPDDEVKNLKTVGDAVAFIERAQS